VLEKERYTVVAADNGAAALKALERRRFDLVLMDVQMPEWTGLKLPRQFETGKKLPADMFHRRIDRHAMWATRTLSEAGMDGYLIKPIQPATLLEAIERLHLARSGRSKSTQAEKIVLDRATLLDRVDATCSCSARLPNCSCRNASRSWRAPRGDENRNAGRFAYDIHTLRGCSATFPLLRRRMRRENWRNSIW